MRMIKISKILVLPLLHSGRLSSGAYLPQEWFELPNGLVASYTNIPSLMKHHAITLQNVNRSTADLRMLERWKRNLVLLSSLRVHFTRLPVLRAVRMS